MARTVLRWALLCAAAEAVGMTTSAVAARLSDSAFPEPRSGAAAAGALGVIVAGGLVEGTALGLAQVAGLRPWLPRLHRVAYLGVTVAVAGLGWAVASAPQALGDDQGGASPPAALMVLGGAGIGLAMGPVLGGAQALVLRGQAPRPWRWLLANAVAWPPAMALIMLGATAPDASWSTPAVALTGTVTGLVAGATLGAVLGGFVPSVAHA